MTKGPHLQKREIFGVDTCFLRSSQVLNANQPDDAGNSEPRSPSACEGRAHRLRHHLRSLLVDEEAGAGNLEEPGRTAKLRDHGTCILDRENGVTLTSAKTRGVTAKPDRILAIAHTIAN
jgi:hypothetical protein